MSDWKDYSNDRKIRKINGVFIVVPKTYEPTHALSCPVCDFVMRTIDDDRAYLDFKCCDRCSRLWAAPNRQKWIDGWRPAPEAISESEALRPPLSVDLKME